MKIAAAEAQWTTCPPLLVLGRCRSAAASNDETPTKIIEVPHLLSILADQARGRRGGGHEQAAGAVRAQYGPGNYIPNVFIQYWSMRVMAYLAALIVAVRAVGRVADPPQERCDTIASGSCGSAPWVVIMPFLMNTAGWMLTENGRQPWIVQGLMKTAQREPRRR